MRKLRDTDRLVDGKPCGCELCAQTRGRREMRRIAIAAGISALVAFGGSWTASDVSLAVVLGLASFALLSIAFVASMEA